MSEAPKITGYRALSDEEVRLINLIKGAGDTLEALVDLVYRTPNVDQRWLAIGRTDLQTGLMALTRAVARPTSF